jgi:hypothetical protein
LILLNYLFFQKLYTGNSLKSTNTGRATLDRLGLHDRLMALQTNFHHINGALIMVAKRAFLCMAMISGCLATGCAALVVGAGAGAGTYTYVNGELARTYPTPYSRTLEVCTQLLGDMGMPVLSQTSEGVQSIIETTRKDGTPMTLKIKIIGLDLTEVSVRTGMVGYWNRDLSEQFHEFLARRL